MSSMISLTCLLIPKPRRFPTAKPDLLDLRICRDVLVFIVGRVVVLRR